MAGKRWTCPSSVDEDPVLVKVESDAVGGNTGDPQAATDAINHDVTARRNSAVTRLSL
jgi:hypothetical protein